MGIRHQVDERVPPNGTGQTTPLPDGYEIDLDILAERVIRLMKQEARLERERLGRSIHRLRRGYHGR